MLVNLEQIWTSFTMQIVSKFTTEIFGGYMKENSEENNLKKSGEIVELILADHKPLKELMKILKDLDRDTGERLTAFEKFAPLLTTHAKSEEKSLYEFMKKDDELRVEALEGDTEHAIADQLVNEIKDVSDEDEWSAKVKVLAELVEHHVEKEENELFPEFKKNTEKKDRDQLGEKYLKLKETYSKNEISVGKNNHTQNMQH